MKKTYPLLLIFLIICILVFTSFKFLYAHYIDAYILLFSNLFLLLMSLISVKIQEKGFKNKNPNFFIRSVIGSMMMKMFAIVTVIVIYVFSSGANFNKRAVFISLIFYLFYLATEVFTVMKMNKKKNA